MGIHREGYKYITLATLALFAIVALSYSFLFAPLPILFWLLATAAGLLWFWVLWFFRMPNRVHVEGAGLVMAPADGKVVVIEETVETEYFKDKRLQVSIFMSPLNVHVNRNPISGLVSYFKYHPGKYLVAWHPKSSTENERTTLVISNGKTELLLRQIAGALARRICFYVKEGDQVKQNEEFGFIRFGSRVDVFFPLGTVIDVHIGQVVQSGITVLAHMSS